MTAGWWIVVGTAVAALVVLAAALIVRARRGSLSGRVATTVPAALGAAALLLALAAAVFALVADDGALETADGPVLGWMLDHRSPARTSAAETVSFVGGTIATGGLAVVSAVVLAVAGRRARSAVWIVAVLVGSLTIRGLKGVVERPRPPVAARLAVEPSTSLPSGHSLMAVLGLGLTVVTVLTLVPPGGRRGAVRAATVLVGAVLAVAIGISRAYLGVHWTTDVTAGWLLGSALLALALGSSMKLEARAVEIHPSEGVSPTPLR